MIGDTDILTTLMQSGTVSVPTLLITHYHRLGLSETDLVVLLHMIVFREKEQITFPTIEQMQSRMSTPPHAVVNSFERLIKRGFMTIEELVDANTGIRSESYGLKPLYEKLAQAVIADCNKAAQETAAASVSSGKMMTPPGENDEETKLADDIFSIFEKEFGRPLTPMECEMISRWIDQDEYSDPLIRAALKEAVFAGKIHFRYIDRILLEWSRNRVRTPDQAKEYAKQFRGR